MVLQSLKQRREQNLSRCIESANLFSRKLIHISLTMQGID
jgi:hypothetical protein